MCAQVLPTTPSDHASFAVQSSPNLNPPAQASYGVQTSPNINPVASPAQSQAPTIAPPFIPFATFSPADLSLKERLPIELQRTLQADSLERYDQAHLDGLQTQITQDRREKSQEVVFQKIDAIAFEAFDLLRSVVKLSTAHLGSDGRMDYPSSYQEFLLKTKEFNAAEKDRQLLTRTKTLLFFFQSLPPRPPRKEQSLELVLNRYDATYFNEICELIRRNRKRLASLMLQSVAKDTLYILKKSFPPIGHQLKEFEKKLGHFDLRAEYRFILDLISHYEIHKDKRPLFEKIKKILSYIHYLMDEASLVFVKAAAPVSPPEASESIESLLARINQIKPKKLIVDSKAGALGNGAFASVSRGAWKGKTVAIKTFKFKADTPADQLEKAWQQEAAFLIQGQRCDQIVKFHGICIRGPKLYDIVMECLQSLSSVLKDKKVEISGDKTFRIIADIFIGLKFLHSVRIVHRDIKSSNILLTDDFHAKLADFGESTFKPLTDADYSMATKLVHGTRQWLGPEVSKKKTFTHKGDVYGAGIVAWEVLSREIPYADIQDEKDVNDAIEKGNTPKIFPTWPEPYRHLMTLCWTYSAEARPTAGELCDAFELNPALERSQEAPQLSTTVRKPALLVEATQTRGDVPRSANPFDINLVSKNLNEFKRKEMDFMIMKACIDGQVRETVTLVWTATLCLVETIDALLALPGEKRDFRAADTSLRKLMVEKKDEAVRLYRVLLDTRNDIIKEGKRIPVAQDVKDGLINEFEAIVVKTFDRARAEFPLNPGLKLSEVKQLLEKRMKDKLLLKDELFESMDMLQAQSEEMKQTPEYVGLMEEREKLRGGFLASTLWVAVENNDRETFEREWSTLQKGIRESVLPMSWLSPDAKSINVKNSLGYTLLHIASYHGHIELVSDLLEKRATRAIPDNQGYNALHWAASEGHTLVCRKLLEKDLSTKTKDLTLLNSQAQAFNEEGIEFGFQRTPLHRAAWHGRADTVQLFVDVGVDVNPQTSVQNGCVTPLHEAIEQEKDDVVIALLKCKRLNVETADAQGRTPLYYAILQRRTDYATTIMLHGSYQIGKDPQDPNSLESLLTKSREESVKGFLREMLSRRDH